MLLGEFPVWFPITLQHRDHASIQLNIEKGKISVLILLIFRAVYSQSQYTLRQTGKLGLAFLAISRKQGFLCKKFCELRQLDIVTFMFCFGTVSVFTFS